MFQNAVSPCNVLLKKIQYCCTICVVQFVNHGLSYVDINAAVLLHFMMTETCCTSQASDFLGLVSNLAPITSSFSSLSAPSACPFPV